MFNVVGHKDTKEFEAGMVPAQVVGQMGLTSILGIRTSEYRNARSSRGAQDRGKTTHTVCYIHAR